MPKSSTTKTADRASAAAPPIEEAATSTALVPIQEGSDAVWVAIDRADEQLVAAEIAGALIETMAYSFSVSGKAVQGLSIVGVAEAARAMAARGLGRIETPQQPIFSDTFDEDGEPIWECMIYVEDAQNGGSTWALATARKYETVTPRNGGEPITRPDRMSKRKALSKAVRNGKKQLVPLEIQLEILNGVAKANLKRIETPAQAQTRQITQGEQTAARTTAAAAPKRETPVSAGQQKALLAKAKVAKLDEPSMKAIWVWVTKTRHLDKIPRTAVQQVYDAYGDADATLAEIVDAAKPDSGHPQADRARWIMGNVLNPQPQAEGEGGGEEPIEEVDGEVAA